MQEDLPIHPKVGREGIHGNSGVLSLLKISSAAEGRAGPREDSMERKVQCS